MNLHGVTKNGVRKYSSHIDLITQEKCHSGYCFDSADILFVYLLHRKFDKPDDAFQNYYFTFLSNSIEKAGI